MADHRLAGAAEPGHDTRVLHFADSVFAHLPRADQRRWAQLYLQGLLITPGRKSIRRLAAAVSAAPATASQSLHQFISASPWDWMPARQELIRLTGDHFPLRALTVGTVVLPKRGEHTCGVHRRFVPAAGRTISCQVGLGAFLTTGEEDLPVDWRLLLPEQWGEDAELRERARVPDAARHRPVWEHVLDLVDSVADALPRRLTAQVPVVADLSEHLDAGRLLAGLERRGLDFVVAVPGALPVLPADPRVSRTVPGAASAPLGPLGARQFLQHHHVLPPRAVTLAAPGGRGRQLRVVSELVRLPGSCRTYRLFTEWHPAETRAPRVWITSLTGRRVEQLTTLAQARAGTCQTVSLLERDYGLLDFEGRSFPGWHHHMTLVSAAHVYDRLLHAGAFGTRPPQNACDSRDRYFSARPKELTARW
ncbi:transposase [Streptomyces sp. NPDC006339]|uniref:IS701 family transposase n=1 Tax=Streptomyces sp. NPDC006339 TaxID=3156755 RepID=UPI0033ADD30E